MLKVIEDFQIDKYRILILDGSRFSTALYRKFLIDGESYEPVSMYDADDSIIAIESSGSFEGKTVEFI
ncbi:MAG: hypothetical protein LUF89_08410 [Ruminococcus sp.]|nr:hypothetical protein [Ruminococcus sp.]